MKGLHQNNNNNNNNNNNIYIYIYVCIFIVWNNIIILLTIRDEAANTMNNTLSSIEGIPIATYTFIAHTIR